MAKKVIHPVVPSPIQDTLHKPDEAFATLGIGKTMGWSLVKSGALEVVRFGKRCTRVRGSSIARLMETGFPK